MADECYTPAWVFEAIGVPFDLDVAAPPGGAALVPANEYYTAADDGLAMPWFGRVWCNPPFSRFTPWADRWVTHGHGALLGTYTPETRWFGRVMAAADCVALVSVKFLRPDGTTIKPRHGCFVAFRGMGLEPATRLAAADRFGGTVLVHP